MRRLLDAGPAVRAFNALCVRVEKTANPRLERVWGIGRLGIAITGIVSAQLVLRGEPAYWLVVGVAAFTILYGLLFLAFFSARESLAVLIAGFTIDNIVLLFAWAGYLNLNRGILESNDLYMIMVPFVLFGIVRVGWLIGAAMAAFWLSWLAWTALYYYPSDSYDVTQLPIRLMVFGVIFVLALRLVAVVARERQLEQARVQHLSDLERFQTALVQSISHELRTPLTSARLYAEMLTDTERSGDPASTDRAGRGLETSIRRLERIVERTTEYAALGTPARIETTVINVGLIAAGVVEQFHVESGESRRHVEVSIADGLPPALGNVRQVERVLTILLDNAAKYSPAGTAIGIDLSADEFRVRVAVSDHGDGLHELDRKFLFSAFFRGARADRHRSPGVGLGLALARQLVRRQGGEIGVSNSPGGTAIYFTLPRSDRPGRH